MNRMTDGMTESRTDTSTDNKGCLKLLARIPTDSPKNITSFFSRGTR